MKQIWGYAQKLMNTKKKLDKGFQVIRFKGNTYILVEDAITTPLDYKHGYPSYAYLCPNGKIMRYGNAIGKKEDILFTGKYKKVKPNFSEGIYNMMFGRGWF